MRLVVPVKMPAMWPQVTPDLSEAPATKTIGLVATAFMHEQVPMIGICFSLT